MKSRIHGHIERWVRVMKAKNYSPKTILTHTNRIQHLTAYVAKKGLHDVKKISRDDLRDFYIRIEDSKKHGVHSLANIVNCVKSFFGFLEDEGVILKSPADCLKAPNNKNLLPRDILTNEEVRKL